MLDQPDYINQQDHHQVLASTQQLALQCQVAWDQTQSILLPSSYSHINRCVVAAMGGSHLGAQLINSVFYSSLKLPLIILNQYHPPAYIDSHTLVIATSYSGNTEETLSFVSQALQQQAKIICICSGGKLQQFAQKHSLPLYVFDSNHNPSRIPRYGSGYLIMSQLSFLSQIKAIQVSSSAIKQLISTIKHHNTLYLPSIPTASNPAKTLAQQLHQKLVVLVAAEHLLGSAYIFKNQLNESAKNFAVLFSIPELNHHLLESLSHPNTNSHHLLFLFFTSPQYFTRNQSRFDITQTIVTNQHIPTTTYTPTTSSKLDQAFETLTFTSYVAIYLSILNHVDPGPNPWVDQLKQQLKHLS